MNSKLHVSLDVTNLEESVLFYSALFDAPPTKLKPGYAKFDLDRPAINLTMQQASHCCLQGLSHLGLRVDSTAEVLAVQQRLNAAGIKTRDEMNTTCCYAVQGKIWLADPTGYRWEVYVFKGDAEQPDASHSQPAAASACCGGTEEPAMTEKADLTRAVRERYGSIARGERSGCGCSSATDTPAIGYSAEDLAAAGVANLGLGCGNPLALAGIAPGMTVLDLGSGAGFDAFLAWRRVGPQGRVIGVDMTDDMLVLARRNAQQLGAANVEFRKGSIEHLPVEEATIDLVISNCVVNLSPQKTSVFREIHRVLKPGGRFALSDIVLLRPLPPSIASDIQSYVGCVAGASLLSDYLSMALSAGLTELSVPQITEGRVLAASLLSGANNDLGQQLAARYSPALLEEASAALISAKVHGRKPL